MCANGLFIIDIGAHCGKRIDRSHIRGLAMLHVHIGFVSQAHLCQNIAVQRQHL